MGLSSFFLWTWAWVSLSLMLAFPLSILNIGDLRNRRLDQELLITIELSSLDFITASTLEHVKIGLMVNGQLCHFYKDRWYDLRVFLPVACLTFDKFWFSIFLELEPGPGLGLDHLMERKFAVSVPIFVPALRSVENEFDELDYFYSQVTLVLPLTFDDISRAYLLLDSLHILSNKTIYEMLIVTPELDLDPIKSLLGSFHHSLSFPLRIVSESFLLPSLVPHSSRNFYPYALQMGIKILVSLVISTSHYLTLDADLLLIHPFNISSLLKRHSSSSPLLPQPHPRAIYEHESREHHSSWWSGSQKYLQIPSDYFPPSTLSSQGFSVTPAVLSTFGSLLLLNRIHDLHRTEHSSTNPSVLSLSGPVHLLSSFNQSIVEWLSSLGVDDIIWSEYTLYRLILDYYHVTRHSRPPPLLSLSSTSLYYVSLFFSRVSLSL
jgi:hypothetical protein